MASQPDITNDTFDSTATLLFKNHRDNPQTNSNTSSSKPGSKVVKLQDCKDKDRIRSQPHMMALADAIRSSFQGLYNLHFGDVEYFLTAKDLLSDNQIWNVVKNYEFFVNGGSLRYILGSNAIEGNFECITNTIKKWFNQHQGEKIVPQVNSSVPTLRKQIVGHFASHQDIISSSPSSLNLQNIRSDTVDWSHQGPSQSFYLNQSVPSSQKVTVSQSLPVSQSLKPPRTVHIPAQSYAVNDTYMRPSHGLIPELRPSHTVGAVTNRSNCIHESRLYSSQTDQSLTPLQDYELGLSRSQSHDVSQIGLRSCDLAPPDLLSNHSLGLQQPKDSVPHSLRR